MKLKIVISLNTDAFKPEPEDEIVRILYDDIIANLQDGDSIINLNNKIIRDKKRQRIGYVELIKDKHEN